MAHDILGKARETVADPADRILLDQAAVALDATWDVVTRQADRRRAMLVGRQKNLFQARPTFEAALNTLLGEVAGGVALRGGVDSAREGGPSAAPGDANMPGLKEVNEYRLAMSRVVSDRERSGGE